PSSLEVYTPPLHEALPSLERGMEAYRQAGVDVHGYVADVTDETAVASMVAKIREEVGIIDILVNNAGIIKRIPMTEMSVEDFSKDRKSTRLNSSHVSISYA